MSEENPVEDIVTTQELDNVEQFNTEIMEGLLSIYPNAMRELDLEDGTKVAYFPVKYSNSPNDEVFKGIVAFSKHGLSYFWGHINIYAEDVQPLVKIGLQSMSTINPIDVLPNGGIRYGINYNLFIHEIYPEGWHTPSLNPGLKPEHLGSLLRAAEGIRDIDDGIENKTAEEILNLLP